MQLAHRRTKLPENLSCLVIGVPVINTGREGGDNLDVYRRIYPSDPIFGTHDMSRAAGSPHRAGQ